VVIPFLLVLAAFWLVSCDESQGGQASDGTTSSSIKSTEQSGDVKGVLGEKVQVGDAVITVRALQATFQPAMPTQRLSESTPAAPGPGESFYQAYVRIENTETTPLRIDPNDFACHIGDKVVGIEPTRSGPYARSLLKNTSLDLVLTFKGPAGYQAELLYSPPWYDGVISIGLDKEGESTTTTVVE
jgi:hypothetical protein